MSDQDKAIKVAIVAALGGLALLAQNAAAEVQGSVEKPSTTPQWLKNILPALGVNPEQGSNGGATGGQSIPLPPRKPPAPVVQGVEPVNISKDWLNRSEIYSLAQKIINRERWAGRVDARLAAAICMVESSGEVAALGDRKITKGPANGLMQVLVDTGEWLQDDMGYDRYAYADCRTDARAGMYFGCAYLHWLSRWNGKARARNWIIESYNGGPNNSNGQTRQYLAKVVTELNNVQGVS
jgi:hypothetical protein